MEATLKLPDKRPTNAKHLALLHFTTHITHHVTYSVKAVCFKIGYIAVFAFFFNPVAVCFPQIW